MATNWNKSKSSTDLPRLENPQKPSAIEPSPLAVLLQKPQMTASTATEPSPLAVPKMPAPVNSDITGQLYADQKGDFKHGNFSDQGLDILADTSEKYARLHEQPGVLQHASPFEGHENPYEGHADILAEWDVEQAGIQRHIADGYTEDDSRGHDPDPQVKVNSRYVNIEDLAPKDRPFDWYDPAKRGALKGVVQRRDDDVIGLD